MTQSLAKSSSTGLAKYDPQKGLKTVAVAEAAEKHYARAKDATQLERAIRLKREALAEFVFWWEKLLTGARIALMDLALEARFTVWYLQLWKDGRVAWADMLKPDAIDVLTRDEYRERLAMWWANRYALEHYAAVTDEILLRRAGVRCASRSSSLLNRVLPLAHEDGSRERLENSRRNSAAVARFSNVLAGKD